MRETEELALLSRGLRVKGRSPVLASLRT
jgi:hypothetical protein